MNLIVVPECCITAKWSFEPHPRWPAENYPLFLIEVVPRSSVPYAGELCPKRLWFSRPQHQQGITVFSLFETGKVQCNSQPRTRADMAKCRPKSGNVPSPQTWSRGFAPKCQDKVDLKVQYHKLTQTLVRVGSGKGF